MPPVVSLMRAESYTPESLAPNLDTLLAPLGGITAFVKAGDRVLLKPNLLTGAKPTKDCTTRPELVYAVAKLVQAAGGKPFLGDSPAFGSAAGVARANGYHIWLEELGIPIVELHGQRYDTGNSELNHLLLSREAIAADVVINLPKIKSHSQLTLTLGVKNLFGCVPGKMKAWWHMEAGKDAARFATMLVETARAIQPNLTIADGIIGHQGNGPSNGEPRNLGILAASADVFALDRALVELLNVPPESVPTIAAAQRLGLNAEAIEFPLQTPDELRITDWKLPDRLHPIDFGAPRVVKSMFKHLYIRLIKEPIAAYSQRAIAK